MNQCYYESELAIVRDSVKEDISKLACNLCPEDTAEIWKSHRSTPEQSLTTGYNNSVQCYTVERNNEPISMFGIVPAFVLGRIATIWSLTSDDVKKVPRTFVRHSKRFIKDMLSLYPILVNYVDCENKKSIAWLKFCGAVMSEPAPFGEEGALFRFFYFSREN